MALGDILGNIVDAVTGRDNNQDEATLDPNNAGTVDGDQGILPASMDPMGDPADQQNAGMFGSDILPASEDPLGDPADDPQYAGQDILPASMDPLGDPADQQR